MNIAPHFDGGFAITAKRQPATAIANHSIVSLMRLLHLLHYPFRVHWIPPCKTSSNSAASSLPATVAPTPEPPTATPEPVLLVPTDTPAALKVEPLTLDNPPCDCSGDTLNCSDFGSGSEAHACYDYCMATAGSDVHQLDRDGDGLMCESR